MKKNEKFCIINKNNTKILISKNYNFYFDKINGFFMRWGKTKDDDPKFSPIGPEIADIELSTICSGINNTPCKFCYKSNTSQGKNMSFKTFKKILNKFPKCCTQFAAGIGSIDANPDLWKIMNYSRKKDIVPNITINGWGVTTEIAEKLVNTCGSIAVSRYKPKDVCYDTVELLTNAGGKQINIHQLVSKETLQDCYELINDVKNDKRLNKLNATLFLMLKKKGRGSCSNYVSSQEYSKLIKRLLKSKIRFGMDSCSANSFLKNINDKNMETMVESCESGLFSIYVDVEGKVHPCSFAENVEWEKGIDLTKIKDFNKEVWNSKLMKEWRKKLLKNKRNCPIYTDIKNI